MRGFIFLSLASVASAAFGVNSAGTAASTADSNPFLCPAPAITVNANGTHVSTLVTSWSALSGNPGVRSGRSTVTYVTYGQSLDLSPSAAPGSAQNPHTEAISVPTSVFPGTCSLLSASSKYPFASTITQVQTPNSSPCFSSMTLHRTGARVFACGLHHPALEEFHVQRRGVRLCGGNHGSFWSRHI